MIRLDAILCLTEYIERDSDVESNDVIATWSDNYLQLTLISVEYPAVELWQAERNILEPLQGPFGRSVSFDSFAPLD